MNFMTVVSMAQRCGISRSTVTGCWKREAKVSKRYGEIMQSHGRGRVMVGMESG